MSDPIKRRRIDPSLAIKAMTSQPGTMNGGFPTPTLATPPAPAQPQQQQEQSPVAVVTAAPAVETVASESTSQAVEVVTQAPALPSPQPRSVAARPTASPRRKPLPPVVPTDDAEDGLPPMVLRVPESYREKLNRTKRLLKVAGTAATFSDITRAALEYYLPLVEHHQHLVPPTNK